MKIPFFWRAESGPNRSNKLFCLVKDDQHVKAAKYLLGLFPNLIHTTLVTMTELYYKSFVKFSLFFGTFTQLSP